MELWDNRVYLEATTEQVLSRQELFVKPLSFYLVLLLLFPAPHPLG